MDSDLSSKHCEACEGIGSALSKEQINNLLPQLDKHWKFSTDNKKIYKNFKFKNFFETISFVNAIAFIANKENHHPDLEVGYNYCNVSFTTHALGGLSQNDFICAAKIDRLLLD